jgi:hypothetical protein
MFSFNRNLVRSSAGLTRREWLRVGGLGPLTLSSLLRGRVAAASADTPPSFGRAKSCILCFLFGAPAHQDVWDLKPDAPEEVRGEFKPIASSVPGLFLGEHIPRIARTAHRFALLRSVAHPDNTHTVAMHYMLTGRRHAQPATNPRNQPGDFPCFGAVAQYLQRGRREEGRIANPSYGRDAERIANPSYAGLPAGISLNAPANQVSAANHIFPGFFAGILGSAFDPLFIAQDPSAGDFRPFAEPRGLTPPARLRLLAQLDAGRRRMEEIARVRDFDGHYQQALSLVTSPAAHKAFDLSAEPPRLRERYGRNSFGQGLLLARRLVEAGVRLVTVNWARDDAFWDTHSNNFRDLKQKLLPPFDLGFSALLEDLDARGLLSETLVVCLGEFGRTPKINAAAGRDHWAACNSVVLAGGGVQPGRAHGASDRSAAYPATTPISPDDLAATIYHCLGIDPRMEIQDREGKPWQLSAGRVWQALF